MRKFLLTCFIALVVFSCTEPSASITSDSLVTGSLADAGMDSVLLSKLDREIGQDIYPNIHALLIARDNKLVFEKYYSGKDEIWGVPKADTTHTADSLHDLRSISKSIVAICTGIAIAQGKIKSVHQKVFEFFPEYKELDTGKISDLTIEHLLTMSSGLKWNEDVPYNDPQNSEIQMAYAPDQAKYVLSQPLDTLPGKVWKYNGGTTQLLAAIIKKTTGMQVDSFAAQNLFRPLDISHFYWARYPGTDIPAAASGLRLRPRDLLKFGLLCYNRGEYNGRQVVPADWIDASFKPQVPRGEDGAYGYQFWLFNDTVDNKPGQLVACVGNGDQRIFFNRDKKLVVVINAGKYNQWGIAKNSHNMLYTYIYPSAK